MNSPEALEALIHGAGKFIGTCAMVAVLIYLTSLLADWRDRHYEE